VFAAEIVDQNVVARKEGRPEINLASVIIGNGNTDISTYVCASIPACLAHTDCERVRRNWPGRYEIECGTAALDTPFQSIGNCVRMKQAVSLVVASSLEMCRS
jgi:hypothetical protein